jgi:multiple sugar transport system substrate-binding protein
MFMDGTVVANMAQLGAIVPVDEYIDSDIKSKFSDSAFVQYEGKIYGLNEQEGGLGFWANKSHLTQAGVRIPTYEQPWTKDEFTEALSKLKSVPGVEYPLDMKMNWGGDYVIYAWQPIIRSFGGNWWDEQTHKVEGTLNGDKTIAAYSYIMDLVKAGYVNNKQTDDALLVSGKASLDLTGHWNYPSYKEALGDDLILIPLPDFGEGSFTAVGGISFTVSKAAQEKGHVKEAMEFINFALGDAYQKQINDANGALPANLDILMSLDSFKEGGDLHLYAQQLEGGRFVVRPESPSFPAFQSEVGKATMDILSGADIKQRLTEAAKAIEQVIHDIEG